MENFQNNNKKLMELEGVGIPHSIQEKNKFKTKQMKSVK